jgi:nucleotide-binding universal stress UspA family protein
MIIERICIATDGSDTAVRAAQMAVLLARTGARRVVAFSVAQPRFPMPGDGSDAGSELQRVQQAARAHVETVARIAHDAGVACEMLTTLSSSPGPEIVRAAEDNDCDLIVMGTHGLNDPSKLIAGSVAQYVLAYSAIPVMVFRDPREASKPEYSDDDVAG